MRLKEQDETFITAWMHCLNNFQCRKLALRILNLSDVKNITYDSATFRGRMKDCFRARNSAFVVKNFDDDECHWIYVHFDENRARVFNTSSAFDMSDVKKKIPYEVVAPSSSSQRIESLQTRRDCFCQTWSIVSAYATRHNLPLNKTLFQKVVSRLWKSRRFQTWITNEVGYLTSQTEENIRLNR